MNVIIGQAHFIKTVEDLHETLAGVSPHLRFGLAFCEASSARLVRRSGNDDELTGQAAANALAIGAGHSFVILLREGFPVNVLNPLKAVPEVCTIFCATANPVDVLVAVTHRGRGIIGVIDGSPPAGIEQDADVADRRSLLRHRLQALTTGVGQGSMPTLSATLVSRMSLMKGAYSIFGLPEAGDREREEYCGERADDAKFQGSRQRVSAGCGWQRTRRTRWAPRP